MISKRLVYTQCYGQLWIPHTHVSSGFTTHRSYIPILFRTYSHSRWLFNDCPRRIFLPAHSVMLEALAAGISWLSNAARLLSLASRRLSCLDWRNRFSWISQEPGRGFTYVHEDSDTYIIVKRHAPWRFHRITHLNISRPYKHPFDDMMAFPQVTVVVGGPTQYVNKKSYQ